MTQNLKFTAFDVGLEIKTIYLKVRSVTKSIHFYCNILGLKLLQVQFDEWQTKAFISLSGNYSLQLCLIECNHQDTMLEPFSFGIAASEVAIHDVLDALQQSASYFVEEQALQTSLFNRDTRRIVDVEMNCLQISNDFDQTHKADLRVNDSKFDLKSIKGDRNLTSHSLNEFDIVAYEISLHVSNMYKSARFYSQVLGFAHVKTVALTMNEIAVDFIVNYEANLTLSLRQPIITDFRSANEKLPISFFIRPVHETSFNEIVKRLQDSHLRFTSSDPGGIGFRDPDGNLWSFVRGDSSTKY